MVPPASQPGSEASVLASGRRPQPGLVPAKEPEVGLSAFLQPRRPGEAVGGVGEAPAEARN